MESCQKPTNEGCLRGQLHLGARAMESLFYRQEIKFERVNLQLQSGIVLLSTELCNVRVLLGS